MTDFCEISAAIRPSLDFAAKICARMQGRSTQQTREALSGVFARFVYRVQGFNASYGDFCAWVMRNDAAQKAQTANASTADCAERLQEVVGDH